MDTESFQRVWRRFATWLAENVPEDHTRLAPPASEAQIAAVEAAYEIELHPELRALLRLHDGTRSGGDPFGRFLPLGHKLINTEVIVGYRDMLTSPEMRGSHPYDRVEGHPHLWVPFAEPNDGGLAFVDHHPGPTYGHVYELGIGSGATEPEQWATSLSAFFGALATAVETGAPFQAYRPALAEFLKAPTPGLTHAVGLRFLDWVIGPKPLPADHPFIVYQVIGPRRHRDGVVFGSLIRVCGRMAGWREPCHRGVAAGSVI
ncbi:SMI1/KNR4 family protein [Actinomadura sp. 21ATH]|uniref:SMI1/KNR4 family protein n=1 Tax=Actinomadura sp. 21ATH TaxID=1735444 RepID=UPI0035C17543